MNPPPPEQCILFDMDGVLVDVSRSYRRAILDTVSHFVGRTIEPALVQQFKNRGGFNDDWELTHAMIRDHGVDADFDGVVAVFQNHYRGDDFDGYIADESPLIDDATLEALSSATTLGIVTGRPGVEALWTVNRFGWQDAFRVVLARENQDGRYKPDPYPLLKALKLISGGGRECAPATSAYVGDTVDDMQAAKAAAVQPVGYVPPYLDPKRHAAVLRSAGAERVLTDFSELLRLAW